VELRTESRNRLVKLLIQSVNHCCLRVCSKGYVGVPGSKWLDTVKGHVKRSKRSRLLPFNRLDRSSDKLLKRLCLWTVNYRHHSSIVHGTWTARTNVNVDELNALRISVVTFNVSTEKIDRWFAKKTSSGQQDAGGIEHSRPGNFEHKVCHRPSLSFWTFCFPRHLIFLGPYKCTGEKPLIISTD